MNIDKEQASIIMKHRFRTISTLLAMNQASIEEVRIECFPLAKRERIEVDIEYKDQIPGLVLADGDRASTAPSGAKNYSNV